ncbi:MAG TPA: hypothetical protein GXX40_04490 [Firmicutes bacterium]|nr:hypothetical protein [Bacillota bacterium]
MRKKLLAITVITAMVLLTLPLTVFAAAQDTISVAASTVSVSANTTKANQDVTMKIRLRQSDGKDVTLDPAESITLYVKADKDSIVYTPKDFNVVKDSSGNIISGIAQQGATNVGYNRWTYAITWKNAGSSSAAINGNLEVQVKSTIATKATFDVCVEWDGVNKEVGGRIGSFTVDWTAPGVQRVELAAGYPDRTTVTANGTDLAKLVFVVYDSETGGLPVKDVEVKFSAKKLAAGTWQDTTDLQFTATSGITDSEGKVTTYVKSLVTGKYAVIAKAGDKKWDGTDSANAARIIEFVAGSVSKIEAVKPTQTVATVYTSGNEPYAEFVFYDSKGNKVDPKDQVVKLEYDGPQGTTTTISPAESDNYTIAEADRDSDTLKFKVKLQGSAGEVDAGTHVITVSIPGKDVKAVATIQAAKQGTVTKVELEEEDGKTVLALGETASMDVYEVDSAGVRALASESDYYWITSDPSKATVDQSGVVTATTNDDDAGEVTITAVNKEDGSLTASYKFLVTKTPTALDVTVPAGTYLENSAITLTAQLKDKDGNKAGVNSSDTVNIEVQVLSKPADATVSVSYADSDREFDANGAAQVDVKCDKAGKVAVMVYAKKSGGWVLGKRVELNFGSKAAFGAKSVVMFIGATGYVKDGAAATMDQAPVIVNGRTLVPVRAVAESLGFTADWAPKDGVPVTVTLTRPDIQITITIGSPTVMVVKNGVSSTVTADVPAQIMGGRTMLPFRAIAEACGATVDWGPKDAVPTWVSFTQQ